MKKIIYHNPNEVANFDLTRFIDSLEKSAHTSFTKKEVEAALTDYNQYDNMHVSCLVEVGTKLINEKVGQEAAEKYFNQYAEYFDQGKFERLRRITGYLVGTLDRWNDAKKAEEHARVKHSVNSSIDDATRMVMLETQAMEQNLAYTR